MSRQIFTFWEPKSTMPGYLHLCMRTWRKFLPDYEVVLCDYENLGNYLSEKTISEILCKQMPLPQQADCIRVALLKKYGGIWLDADTIITSADCFQLMKGPEVVMIGRPKTGRINVGFIHTTKPNTDFIATWYSALLPRIRNYRLFNRISLLRWIFRNKWNEMTKWNYWANAIINPISKSFPPDKFMLIDRDSIGALPDLSTIDDTNLPLRKVYQNFYLEKGNAQTQVLDKTKGIVLLHNSRMPKRYRDMDADEFLRQDVLLADLLKTVLS